jgi:hypothetical protein
MTMAEKMMDEAVDLCLITSSRAPPAMHRTGN